MFALVASPLVQPAPVKATGILDDALGHRRVLVNWFTYCSRNYTACLHTDTAHELNLDTFMNKFLSVTHSHSNLWAFVLALVHACMFTNIRAYLSCHRITIIVYRAWERLLFLPLHFYLLAFIFALQLDFHIHRRREEIGCHYGCMAMSLGMLSVTGVCPKAINRVLAMNEYSISLARPQDSSKPCTSGDGTVQSFGFWVAVVISARLLLPLNRTELGRRRGSRIYIRTFTIEQGDF